MEQAKALELSSEFVAFVLAQLASFLDLGLELIHLLINSVEFAREVAIELARLANLLIWAVLGVQLAGEVTIRRLEFLVLVLQPVQLLIEPVDLELAFEVVGLEVLHVLLQISNLLIEQGLSDSPCAGRKSVDTRSRGRCSLAGVRIETLTRLTPIRWSFAGAFPCSPRRSP